MNIMQLNLLKLLSTLITRGGIGKRIWIYQIIKRTTDSTDNNTYTELFKFYRVEIDITLNLNKKQMINTAVKLVHLLLGGSFNLLHKNS